MTLTKKNPPLQRGDRTNQTETKGVSMTIVNPPLEEVSRRVGTDTTSMTVAEFAAHCRGVGIDPADALAPSRETTR